MEDIKEVLFVVGYRLVAVLLLSFVAYFIQWLTYDSALIAFVTILPALCVVIWYEDKVVNYVLK